MAVPIYVIGSSNTDMVVKVKNLPLPGETVMGGDFFINPGGKGANQAVAAARLGGQVHFVACIGNDVFGKQSVKRFQHEEHIDTSLITLDADHPSGVALIVVDTRGENSITVAPGSNHFLLRDNVKQALERVKSPAILLLQMEIPLDTIEYGIQLGHEMGLQVILNPAPAQPIHPAVFKYLDWVTPNESEAEALTGIPVHDEPSAAAAARKLRELGVVNVLITLGSKGAYFQTATISKRISAPHVENVVDTTAAGDCFNGALAVALSEGHSKEEAVLFACRAASRSVTRLGAQASLPYRNEIDFLFT